ncbi:hypothetical protein Ac2012v2_000816 [Leucoagaricus gongylophorus]
MSEIAAVQKQLKIKCGVVRRYENEDKLYHGEVKDLQRKLDQLTMDGVGEEEWDVKNTKRMIEESNKMILDVKQKLVKAIGELRDVMKLVEEKPGVVDTEEFRNAEGILKKKEEEEA